MGTYISRPQSAVSQPQVSQVPCIHTAQITTSAASPPSVFQFQAAGGPDDSREKSCSKIPGALAAAASDTSGEGKVIVAIFCEFKNNNSVVARCQEKRLVVP